MPKKKNPAAVALGKRGGKAKAKNMTPRQRSEAMRKVVNARWAKQQAKLKENKS